MEIRFDPPLLNGATSPEEQIRQLKSYLFNLSQDLNVALSSLDADIYIQKAKEMLAPVGMSEETETAIRSQYVQLRDLIVKTADVVYDVMEQEIESLDGLYVAVSEFGTFRDETNSKITKNATSIEQRYRELATLTSRVDGIDDTVINVTSNIKTGKLDEVSGVPIYGVEVGQKTKVNGVEAFNKYARFTADRLSFYDQSGNEISYISDRKLFITNAVITDRFRVGGYEYDTSDGIIHRWVGEN